MSNTWQGYWQRQQNSSMQSIPNNRTEVPSQQIIKNFARQRLNTAWRYTAQIALYQELQQKRPRLKFGNSKNLN